MTLQAVTKSKEHIMNECTILSKGMLPNPIEITIDQRPVDFKAAKSVADDKAREVGSDPMLLAWFDGSTGRFSPNVTCCGDDKPTWLVYAESRGGNLSVYVNNGEYVFVYSSGQ